MNPNGICKHEKYAESKNLKIIENIAKQTRLLKLFVFLLLFFHQIYQLKDDP